MEQMRGVNSLQLAVGSLGLRRRRRTNPAAAIWRIRIAVGRGGNYGAGVASNCGKDHWKLKKCPGYNTKNIEKCS
jgi:hypothetical protein